MSVWYGTPVSDAIAWKYSSVGSSTRMVIWRFSRREYGFFLALLKS